MVVEIIVQMIDETYSTSVMANSTNIRYGCLSNPPSLNVDIQTRFIYQGKEGIRELQRIYKWNPLNTLN